MLDRDGLCAEALRLHARYVVEVVEGLSLCPWAKAARLAGRVHSQVVLGDAGEELIERVCGAVLALERRPEIDIGLLILPELTLERVPHQHFTARVRERYQQAVPRALFAIADFHPDAEPSFESPAQLVPFLRRSPDPSLQLVRHSAIEAVRLGGEPGTRFFDARTLHAEGPLPEALPTLSERVARANLESVRALGVERAEALLADIARDRDASYARLGLPPPTWRAAAAR